MIELAINNKKKEGIYQKDISKNQDISFKYLDQIISGLKSSGLITSVAGKKSGYRLAKDPDKITAYDIYTAFNPELAVIECLIDEEVCIKSQKCAAKNFWQGLNANIIKYLNSVTVEDLAKQQVELNQQRQELTFQI